MRNVARRTAIWVTSAVWLGGVGPLAAQTCNGIFGAPGISSRQLYLVSDRSPIPSGGREIRGRPEAINLAYIVPGHGYTSGVVVIKTRHRLQDGRPNANPTIEARRLTYKSPCIQKTIRPFVPEYSNKRIRAERYIRYHKYRLPDRQAEGGHLSGLHADIGNRSARDNRDSDGRCASTHDWDIAPHFLFEMDLADRQPADAAQRFAERGRGFLRAVNPSAYGEGLPLPSEYTSAVNHSALVIPYQKAAEAMSCVAFSIAVPPTAIETHVTVLDADDARWPRPNPEREDPQRTWPIRWVNGSR